MHRGATQARRTSRRTWRGAALLVLIGVFAATANAFDLDDVAAKAQQLAQEPFKDPKGQVPEWLLHINYDQLRDIRFRPDHALWRDTHLPFQVQFFHPGLYHDRTVAVNEIDAAGIHPVAFSTAQFDYGKNTFVSKVPKDLGYAGFRIHAPINGPDYYDEVIVFLGASYFRAVAKDEVYGGSARGLAIDTVESWGEEFPYFKEFWLLRPAVDATGLTIYALLDGPSVTGAYRFTITPGAQTVVDVDLRLFPRKLIHKLGIAPLTSMFFFGENTTQHFDNFRPEIHDSDGLLMAAHDGEWIWRPLDNPRTLEVNGFEMRDPKGFGLVQRDRSFDHFQDLETRQERRPSMWIAPRGDWGAGHVELVQIPTQTDINDNIVAYWVPATAPSSDTPLAYAYTLSWYGDDPARPPAGRVLATRRESGKAAGAQRFVVDFDGTELNAVPGDAAVRAVMTVVGGDAAGELIDQHVIKNPVTGGWRLSFQVRPKRQPVELRAFLERAGSALTETWTYTLQP